MGKGGRGGKNKAARADAEDDDALLDAAIASNQATLQKLELDKAEAEALIKAKVKRIAAAKEKAEADAAARDAVAPPLSRQEICQKLDALPAFCIVDQSKQFVPTVLADDARTSCCVFFTEPHDARRAIQQAKTQRPDGAFALGTLPLGRAFALCEGWAAAEGASTFRLRGHAQVAKELRPVLTRQLAQQGLPTAQVFPVFTCAELTTEGVMPFFLSRAEMVATWEEVARRRGGLGADKSVPPPSEMTVLDLRFLAHRMQSAGVDWSVVQFVGTERAHAAVREGQQQEAAREATQSDPEAEPPPLVSLVGDAE